MHMLPVTSLSAIVMTTAVLLGALVSVCGWSIRRDILLKQDTSSRMARFVRTLLGVYTRGV